MTHSSSHNSTMLPIIVSLAMFMESLDTTILNTAIPSMAHSLQANPIDLKITLIGYLISLAIFIPISGWIADKFGLKRVFISAIILFGISSIFCGIANNLWELIIARFIQGLGGSLMLPLGRLIIVRVYPKHELINTMGRVVLIGALGIMIGPTLGGLITTHLSWRWIFYINVPIGILNLVLAIKWLPTLSAPPPKSLDKLGFILFGLGLATLTFGLSALSESSISAKLTSIILLSSITLLTLYFIHARKQLNPIINTHLFHYRTFTISIIGNLFTRLSSGSLPFLLPLLLQINLAYSPAISGLLLAPIALGILSIRVTAIRILRLLGYKKLLMINSVLIGLILCAYSFINATTSFAYIIILNYCFGLLNAVQFTSMNSLLYAEVDTHLYSPANSIFSTFQQVFQSFGVAAGALLAQVFASHLSTHSDMIPLSALHHTFITMGIVTTSAIFFYLKLEKKDGEALIHHHEKQDSITLSTKV